jgi:hypothetical protein
MTINPNVPKGNRWNSGKVPLQIHGSGGTKLHIVNLLFRVIVDGRMGRAEQYRRHAAECFRLAQQAQDPEERDTLLGMAAAWHRLAEHAENSDDDDYPNI